MGEIRKNKLLINTARVVFISWIIVVTVLSFVSFSRSDDNNNLLFSSSRAEVHAVAYFIGAVLCFYSFRLEGIGFVLLAGIGVFIFGVIFEVVQLWIPYRTFNPMDIVANGAGAGLFIILWLVFLPAKVRIRPTHKKPI